METLSNIQIELLKIYKFNIPEKQLQEIRKLLANYFEKQATDEMDSLWKSRGWSNATMEEWANEHMRKP